MNRQTNESMMGSTRTGSVSVQLFIVFVIFWITVCIIPASVDAFSVGRQGDVPLTGTHTAFAVVIGVGSILALVYALFNCSCCDESSLLKYEETPEEDDSIRQAQDDDFSPPTESTPSRKPPLVTTEEDTPELVTAAGNIDASALQTFDDPELQFPRDQLNYVDEIGSGWFGKALQGEAHQIHPGMRKTRVIVKQLRDSAASDEQVLFLKEVQMYREVNHPNVMMLLGQCLETSPLLVILEYAPNGDLKGYLQKNKGLTQSFAQDDVQLKMASDLASGLLWLHQADFIHIDLAARNCQVCADDVVKIGDYGISLEKYPDDYCMTKDGQHAMPIRWLAPEVIDVSKDNIEPKKITKQSNIWSFGVIMLELSTGAETPYPKLTNEEVLQKIVKDKQIQLDKPNLAMKYADRWFDIMMFCWLDVDQRTTIKELNDLLHHLKGYKEQLNKDDFESRWNDLKPAAVRDESSESSIEVPSPQDKLDPGENNFQSDLVVETEISTTPEQHQMQERPFDPFENDSTPTPEQGVSETTKQGNPFLKDLFVSLDDDQSGKSDSLEPLQASTPMMFPTVRSPDLTKAGDISDRYVTASASLLDIGMDNTLSESDTFNTVIESMMSESLKSLGLDGNEVANVDQTIFKPEEISVDFDVHQNADTGPDLFHSEAGIAIAEKPVAVTHKVTEQSPTEDIHGFAQVERKAATGKPKRLTLTVSSGKRKKTLEIDNEKGDATPKGGQGVVLLGTSVTNDAQTISAGVNKGTEEESQKGNAGLTISSTEDEDKDKAQDKEVNVLPAFQTNIEVPKIENLVETEPEPVVDKGTIRAADSPTIDDDEENKDCKRGKLEFSVIYNEKKENLQCLIHRAHNLKAMDPNGFSDPYVKLHILPRASSRDRSTKLRTKTKFKTLNPDFTESLQYHGITKDDLQSKTLRLSVWDEDSLGYNDFIGEYLLPLEKLPFNETIFYSKYLQDQSEEDEISSGERGKILIGLQYFQQQNQMNVVITRCVGLAAMDNNGYSDPYVKLYLQPDPNKKTKKKTATKKKTLNPEYNEKFLYKIPASDIHIKTLEISVWDKDVGTNDYIGGIQLGSTTKGDRRQHWIDAIENPSKLIDRWHLLSEVNFTDDD